MAPEALADEQRTDGNLEYIVRRVPKGVCMYTVSMVTPRVTVDRLNKTSRCLVSIFCILYVVDVRFLTDQNLSAPLSNSGHPYTVVYTSPFFVGQLGNGLCQKCT